MYCYDVYGGPGYIDPDNLDRHAWYNFSGRSEPIKRDAESLLEDLDLRYEQAVLNLPRVYQIALERYCFTTNFDCLNRELLRRIGESSVSHARPVGDGLTVINDRSLCEAFIERFSRQLASLQAFFLTDADSDVSEEHSMRLRYSYRTQVTIDFGIEMGNLRGRVVRIDPDDRPVICSCQGDVDLVAVNALRKTEEGDRFITFDPIYISSDHEGIHRVTLRADPIDCSQMVEMLARVYSAHERLCQEIDDCKCMLAKHRFLVAKTIIANADTARIY